MRKHLHSWCEARGRHLSAIPCHSWCPSPSLCSVKLTTRHPPSFYLSKPSCHHCLMPGTGSVSALLPDLEKWKRLENLEETEYEHFAECSEINCSLLNPAPSPAVMQLWKKQQEVLKLAGKHSCSWLGTAPHPPMHTLHRRLAGRAPRLPTSPQGTCVAQRRCKPFIPQCGSERRPLPRAHADQEGAAFGARGSSAPGCEPRAGTGWQPRHLCRQLTLRGGQVAPQVVELTAHQRGVDQTCHRAEPRQHQTLPGPLPLTWGELAHACPREKGPLGLPGPHLCCGELEPFPYMP